MHQNKERFLTGAAAATVLHLLSRNTEIEAEQRSGRRERERERERGRRERKPRRCVRKRGHTPREITQRNEKMEDVDQDRRRRRSERARISLLHAAEKVQPSPSGTQALRLRCPSLSARFL